MPRRRLDVELVRRGLASSRAEAQAAVEAGRVTVAGNPTTKPASLVAADVPVQVIGPTRRFVSRGGEKLRSALDRFHVDARDRRVPRRRGVDRRVHRLPPAGGSRPRGGRRRGLWPAGMGDAQRSAGDGAGAHERPRSPARSICRSSPTSSSRTCPSSRCGRCCPRSFGSRLRMRSSSPLVKPQFEAGPADVGSGGVVRDPEVWRRVLREVIEAFGAHGVGVLGVVASPLRGPAGNVEFLLHGRRGVQDAPVDVDAAVTEGEGLTR